MRPARALRWLRSLWVVGPALVASFGCGKDPLVGGSCKEGLTECDLTCVNLGEDARNCGVCGHVCSGNLICFGGICADPSAAQLRDAAIDVPGMNASTEAGGDDAAASDGSSTGADGSDEGGPGCQPPFNTAEHCGDCATACADPTPVCGLAASYKCLSACESPLLPCGGGCVDTFSDEYNCGACGASCPSGICQAGKCVGRGFGHEFIIGMDYDAAESTLVQTSVQVAPLANAVLLSERTAVRVLAYDEFADTATASRINGWLTAIGSSRGRSVTFTSVGAFTDLPAKLTVSDYDVLMVYDQPNAPAGQMATVGTLANGPIDAFAKGGGVVVALDGHSPGQNAAFLTNAGLLSVDGETDIAVGMQLHVDAPADVVGVTLPDVFAAKRSTVSFTTDQVPDNHHVFVVKDASGLPVIVHVVP